jgi:hypothetical protein
VFFVFCGGVFPQKTPKQRENIYKIGHFIQKNRLVFDSRHSYPPVSCGFRPRRHNLLSAAALEPAQAKLRLLRECVEKSSTPEQAGESKVTLLRNSSVSVSDCVCNKIASNLQAGKSNCAVFLSGS